MRKRSPMPALIGAAIGSTFLLALGIDPLSVFMGTVFAVVVVELAGW